MLKNICLLFLFLIFPQIIFAQDQNDLAKQYLDSRGEVYFQFKENDPAKIQSLSKLISLDKRIRSEWFAYANAFEFELFKKENLPFKVLDPPSLLATKTIVMANDVSEMKNWDRYPTYSVYLSLMQSFAQNHPALCKIDTIGNSVKGRLILAARIGKDIDRANSNPEFFYSSSIHGDELTGFVLMLRLIDYLLENNQSNPYIAYLLENIQIYINPLMNPDGTYRVSDSTVFGATRYNSNNVDLNRNFPDPFGTISANSRQKETQVLMDYFSKHNFVMSACLHGGAEVVNYPWDSYLTRQKSIADRDWWQMISKAFVDTCRTIDPNRFWDVTESGITAGGDWYIIQNGRQDYVNAYHHCREATLEISYEKLPFPDKLNYYWDLLGKSLLQYMGQAIYGLSGQITDSLTSEPLQAKIWINNYDKDNSHIYSSSLFGDYHRPLKAGTYSITFSAPGYRTKKISNVKINDNNKVLLDVRLTPFNPFENVGKNQIVFPNPAKDYIEIISKNEPISKIQLYSINGKLILTETLEEEIYSWTSNLKQHAFEPGVYVFRIFFSDNNPVEEKVILIR